MAIIMSCGGGGGREYYNIMRDFFFLIHDRNVPPINDWFDSFSLKSVTYSLVSVLRKGEVLHSA